jgi:phosphoesterase RecJ-like protein
MSPIEDFEQVIAELERADKFLLTTHQNPDGDALGSLIGMHELLTRLGKDSVMFLAEDQFPLPHEYRHMALDGVVSTPPDDVGERVAVFLDCGNINRMPVDFLLREGVHIVNIDHHHDNTRFGMVNLVMPSVSCAAEIVYRLANAMNVEVSGTMAEALYIGVITDTGRFMYENTTAESHLMAADLVRAGVLPHETYRQVFEGIPERRLLLLGRALSRLERYDDGVLTLTHLRLEDFLETGSDESDSEGVVDYFRCVEGTAVGALVRARLSNGSPDSHKVSLRATDDRVDVSVIARGFGGGGHRQAAGFFSDLSVPDLVARIREEIGAQLEVAAKL